MKALLLNDKILKTSIIASSFVPSFALADTDTSCNTPSPGGSDLTIQNGANCAKSSSNTSDLFGANGTFHVIANTLIYIVGAVAVIMLIIGGLRYVISQGNESSVKGAKDTILYAVIGIIVAILAYAVVNFVIQSIAPSSS